MWCVRRDLATSWKEVLKLGKPITVGANAPGGLSSTLGPEFAQALGGPVKIIFGYGGASEVLAGFDRKELDSVQSICSKAFPGVGEAKAAGSDVLVVGKTFQ